MPDDSIKGWMFSNLDSSKRHHIVLCLQMSQPKNEDKEMVWVPTPLRFLTMRKAFALINLTNTVIHPRHVPTYLSGYMYMYFIFTSIVYGLLLWASRCLILIANPTWYRLIAIRKRPTSVHSNMPHTYQCLAFLEYMHFVSQSRW